MHAKSSSGEMSIWESLKTFVKMMRDTYASRYHPGFWNLILGTLVIIYVISPLDLIPGVLIDDVAIVYFALKFFKDELLKYREWKYGRKYKTIPTDAIVIND